MTAILRPAVGRLVHLVRVVESWLLSKAGVERRSVNDEAPDLRVLNCRIRPTREKRANSFFDVFSVEVCGSIRAPSSTERAGLCVFIKDVTDGAAKAQWVQSQFKQWQVEDSAIFRYNTDLGKLPNTETTLPDWTSLAKISVDWLTFPRKGRRKLRFMVSVLSHESGRKLACTECDFMHDNPVFGYLDLQENLQRVRTLAVSLAFAVSAVDGKLYNCEVEVIKDWARGKIGASEASEAAKERFENALEKTVDFFRRGNQVDSEKVCKEIADIAPFADRYDVLELCLCVAQANGRAHGEELKLLKRVAQWLQVEAERFRTMVEKILPSDMHEVKDVEVILGVTADMDREQTRRHLNKEYRKWNARVTSCDPEIQNQADSMLEFIAEARRQYIA
ncbi:MAG: tellurite resistance TerB family protein [Planctomycetota bacterium]|jgi:tellurite resistance protein